MFDNRAIVRADACKITVHVVRTKRMMTKGHQMATRKHLENRVFERFGVTIEYSDIYDLIESIKAGTADKVDTLGGGKEAYLAEIKGALGVWIYDPESEMVVTVLTQGMHGKLFRKLKKKYKRESRKKKKLHKIICDKEKRFGFRNGWKP